MAYRSRSRFVSTARLLAPVAALVAAANVLVAAPAAASADGDVASRLYLTRSASFVNGDPGQPYPAVTVQGAKACAGVAGGGSDPEKLTQDIRISVNLLTVYGPEVPEPDPAEAEYGTGTVVFRAGPDQFLIITPAPTSQLPNQKDSVQVAMSCRQGKDLERVFNDVLSYADVAQVPRVMPGAPAAQAETEPGGSPSAGLPWWALAVGAALLLAVAGFAAAWWRGRKAAR